ncbi:MAG: hypothetical protein CME70_14030 [Halobacteriovorax sp.]|nr:hypothetical protein [Halobacteriovorax sp.]|tara:strand:- start:57 stop:425 length:369 start_codon:yes stop_codon:yes gene_type:complete
MSSNQKYYPTGDCYEVAASLILDSIIMFNPNSRNSDGLILVHAEVTGQGPIEGIKYGHAWVEKDGQVIDNSNGNNIRLPISVYYRMGKVGTNIYKYTPEEVRRWVLKTETYGPWELETESGY